MKERIVDSWLEPRKEVYAAEQAHLPEFRHPNFRSLEESPGFRDAPAALGLNSQWVSVSRIWGQSMKDILNIAEILDVHTLVAIGKPAYEPKPGQRRPLSDIVHRNTYGPSKYRTGEDIQLFILKLRRDTIDTENTLWSGRYDEDRRIFRPRALAQEHAPIQARGCPPRNPK